MAEKQTKREQDKKSDQKTAQKQQDKKAEINSLRNASIYSPNDAGMALQIGLTHYQEQNFQDAQSEFQRALIIMPNYSDALYYLGLTYDQQGQKNNAIVEFEKLVRTRQISSFCKSFGKRHGLYC